MDALELALRCSSLLLRTMGGPGSSGASLGGGAGGSNAGASSAVTADHISEPEHSSSGAEAPTTMNESDVENHFNLGEEKTGKVHGKDSWIFFTNSLKSQLSENDILLGTEFDGDQGSSGGEQHHHQQQQRPRRRPRRASGAGHDGEKNAGLEDGEDDSGSDYSEDTPFQVK